MKYIISLIFLSFAIICNGQQKANSANTVEKVIIKKSDCMSGKCLVYTIIIHKDGKVYLEALRNIPNNLQGTYTSKLGYLD